MGVAFWPRPWAGQMRPLPTGAILVRVSLMALLCALLCSPAAHGSPLVVVRAFACLHHLLLPSCSIAST